MHLVAPNKHYDVSVFHTIIKLNKTDATLGFNLRTQAAE